MSDAQRLASRKKEFEDHVWDHTVDPFQMGYDARRPLEPSEAGALRDVAGGIADGHDDQALAAIIKKHLDRDPDTVDAFLQLAGLTRNKILTDLRAMAGATRISVPSSYLRLHKDSKTWEVAGAYLATRLRKTIGPISPIRDETLMNAALESINQATWPGWIRQQRAKEQGHQAEYRLATLLKSIGIPFVPEDKAENHPTADIRFNDDISFDLIVPNAEAPRMVVKSTVHTANIGQYGESKDHLEVSQAVAWLEKTFERRNVRPLLFALIDGVGFRSNKAGLEGVLDAADEFCQFRTLWKAAVVAAHCVGKKLDLALPEGEMRAYREFLGAYAHAVNVETLSDEARRERVGFLLIEAGDGLIRVPDPKDR